MLGSLILRTCYNTNQNINQKQSNNIVKTIAKHKFLYLKAKYIIKRLDTNVQNFKATIELSTIIVKDILILKQHRKETEIKKNKK